MQIPWGNGWTPLILFLAILLVLILLAPTVARKQRRKKEYVITIEGIIQKVLDDDLDHRGGMHQRLFVQVTKILDNPENVQMPRKENVFVALRYGDRDGFKTRVKALDTSVGNRIEIRGKYVPKEPNNPKAPSSVIHFTHKPVGYIRYSNKTYR